MAIFLSYRILYSYSNYHHTQKTALQNNMNRHIILLSLGAAVAITACGQSNAGETDGAARLSVSAPATTISQADFIKAAESTVNGVVSVKSYITPRRQAQQMQGYGMDPFSDPFFQHFFGMPSDPRQQPRQQQPEEKEPEQQQSGLGSGVIISKDGYVVTNNHVIDGAERLEVTLNDNRNFTATIVGTDPVTDLALIKIDAPDLHVIPMGDSENLHLGEWVLAVGNPFGFTSTVTSGIVSAKARNISTTTQTPGSGGIEAYIQTDAAVNRGNSGGALVNLRGELVGINTAIYSQTGTYAGCSFAIPTSIVNKVVNDLKQYGAVQRAILGIQFRELTPEFIAKEGIKGATQGIYVAEVQDHSAAFEGGVKPGDIIVMINHNAVNNTARMQEIMARQSPGDRITLGIIRDGKPKELQVTLRNRSGNTAVTSPDNAESMLGAKFKTPDAELMRKLEISRGVQVEITGKGRFSTEGISDGFIITSINRTKVSSPDDIEKIFKAIRSAEAGDDKVMFISGIYPSGKQAYYAVDLAD